MRKAFTSHAAFVVNKILRFPQNSQVSRYLIVIVTFAISALLHIVSATTSFQCGAAAQIRYYASIVLAIFIEDTVIWAYRSARQAKEPKDDPNRILWQLVGYTWVFSFHVWSVSKLVYLSALCPTSA